MELITSKLFVPTLRPNIVPRPRLLQILKNGLRAKRKLTMVSAPAGFGKTTLVVDWLDQIALPVAWLSLDEGDNDPRRFLAYLAAAFQQVDEEIGVELRSALQSPQLQGVEIILTGFLNEIALRIDPLILVLDDYHLLTETEVLEIMDFLIQHQPPQLHLVLTTREDPNLPLARLRARDQITEIRARDLRFTRAEVEIFLRDVMGLAISEQDVDALEDRTEGWAVGLQLAGLSMQNQADPREFIANFSGSHRHILDYLTDEVIRQQPEDIQTFLLQSAILDRLSGPLCDALSGRNDSDRVLAHLEAANLFVIPLDEDRQWYRYHHLFTDLLRSQLTRTQPGWIPELHRRASRWYETQGDIQSAVEHALQDADLNRAKHLIEKHAIPMLYQGRVELAVGWFDQLPEGVFQLAPMLCISKAWALALMQRDPRVGEVEQALHAADQALDQANAGEALRDLVAGHSASIQAFLLQSPVLMGEKPEKLIHLSHQAQRLLPKEEKAIRSVNALNIGYGYLALTDLDAARRAFHEALEDGLAGGNYYAAIYGPTNLVLIALLVGQLREALHLCDTNIERFNRLLAGQNFPSIGALYILKGALLLEYDQLEEAERVLMEGLDLIRWTGEFEAHKRGYTTLARLRAIQGNRPATIEAAKTLEETWPQGALFAQSLRHRLATSMWPDNPEVRKEAQFWLEHSGIAFGSLGIINSVDPVNEAYFESYLGAAHVLARLAQGNPGAFPVENVHVFLDRQMEFAETHRIVSWMVMIDLARTLLFQAVGKKAQALESLQAALYAAAPTGLFRIFLDECDPLLALLEELKPRLTDEAQNAYANRLVECMRCKSAKPETVYLPEAPLSERELEVLWGLANGQTYEEIGQQLFLSLNTIQFHVKNIYGKLMVNKRVQAIEKARALKLL